jgi:acetone carboxylase gamma subunit
VQLSNALELREVDGNSVIACLECGHELSAASENYKLGCLLEETPVTAVNRHLLEPSRFVDDEIVFRRFYCPGCAVQIETELARPGEEPLWDMEIR